jgi:hypothetical protein
MMVDLRKGLDEAGRFESYLRNQASSGRLGELPTLIPLIVGIFSQTAPKPRGLSKSPVEDVRCRGRR